MIVYFYVLHVAQIRDRVDQRRVLMRRNRDETELEQDDVTNGNHDAHGDDLLSLVCALELSTLSDDYDDTARENIRNRIRAKLLSSL